MEGVYRVNGGQLTMKKLKTAFDQGNAMEMWLFIRENVTFSSFVSDQISTEVCQQSFVKLSAIQFLPHLNEKTKPANCWKHDTKLDRETRGRCSIPNWWRKVARDFFNQSQSIRTRSQSRKYLSHCVNYWLTRALFQMLEECCWLWTTAVFMTSLVYWNSTSDSFPIRSFRVPCTNNSLQRDVSICRFINLPQFFTFSFVQLWCSISQVRFSKSIFTLNGCPLLL